ncbi:PBECR2 nuclease fold domain-containing protein [Helicobacter sp. 14348-15]|uniref:PBECR2 nuclease fold domain-containing protein n=1 Tax=Helicobacter TaxID=209 RepID=UPI001F59C470|nr:MULTISPECIES: PBECR2 nuclease fold domain-containing protein [Helicobacter]MCI2236817.1 hypothetical protein [Helicobacter sp. CaF467b]MCL9821827.1 PBECR2 nuclease fold domain-containing protein [Helicobacter colisuis]
MNEKLINFLKQSIEFFKNLVRNDKNKKESNEALQYSQVAQNVETKSLKDEVFTDSKGKEHILTKETQEQWLSTFGLKSLDEAYIPKQSAEVKEALGGKEIKLQLGSLKKLVSQGREEFIPQIKQVLDEPEAVLKDEAGDFLLIKHLKDDDYFVNVSFDNGEFLISISNGIKESNNLKNKLNAGAEVLYQSPNASSILQTLLQASRYSTNKIDNESITQNTNSFYSRFKNRLKNIDNNLAKEKEKPKDTQELKDTEHHKSQRRQK